MDGTGRHPVVPSPEGAEGHGHTRIETNFAGSGAYFAESFPFVEGTILEQEKCFLGGMDHGGFGFRLKLSIGEQR